MRVIFLLSRFTKFFENVIENVAMNDSVSSVLVCYWENDHLPIEPYFKSQKILCVEKSEIGKITLFSKKELNLVYLPGWMDKTYLKIIRKSRPKFNLVTVSGFDDQWNWSLRKIIGSLYFRLFLKSIFDFAWVAGSPQYMYARMFGFQAKNIGYNLLTSEFENEYVAGSNTGIIKFLFVGRLVKEKNLELFLKAFDNLKLQNCELNIVGEGYLDEKLRLFEGANIHFSGYLTPPLVKKKMQESDVYVLPSKHEQWSVSMHEACSNSMICLTSENVGANSMFLIHGFSGYKFNPESIEEMQNAIEWVVGLKYEERESKKRMSYKLSKRIDVDIVSSSFLSFGWQKC